MSNSDLAALASFRPTQPHSIAFQGSLLFLAAAISIGLPTASGQAAPAPNDTGNRYTTRIQPILKSYCLGCHSKEKHKGDLDLERFDSFAEVVRHPKVWQGVVEQLGLGEMPPKEKPQPTQAERDELVAWVSAALDEAAIARAGDPGPVVLRRLNNAEYTYTIRDLTDVSALDPAKEFPADSAAGEGFMNTGNSLVMSPALLTKYFDAGKEIAAHAVLVPGGIAFSPSTSQRDWTEERLTAIRRFYGRFSVNGGGSAVNLQGIKFETKDGGVLPLDRYFEASLELRRSQPRPSPAEMTQLARNRQLSPKYLTALWSALSGTNASLVLEPLRSSWTSSSATSTGLVQSVALWQQALWRFTQVGHIGKRDGPSAWQVPVVPLAESREVRLKLPTPASPQAPAVFYLVASDAGDGSSDDLVVWEKPRLSASGRPDLLLRDIPVVVDAIQAHRERVTQNAARSLAVCATLSTNSNSGDLAVLSQKHGLDPMVLSSWMESLGLGSGSARIEGHLTQKLETAQGHDFIKGWTGPDALGVLANASGEQVRIPGTMKPHSVAVHPSPKRRVVVGWRSPIAGTVRVKGSVQHAHTECGNGVTWAVELRRGQTRQTLATGNSQGAKEIALGPFDPLGVKPGDIFAISVGPRDGNHSCDLTAINLHLEGGDQAWDLAEDVSADLLAGNPHADRQGRPDVWHFFSEPDNGKREEIVIPPGSILARWLAAPDHQQKSALAADLQKLLAGDIPALANETPDAMLKRELLSLNGPLLRSLFRPENLASLRSNTTQRPSEWGVLSAKFGARPEAEGIDATSLAVRAPAVLEVHVPAELAQGSEFVATGRLHPNAGGEASVQMQAALTRPNTLGSPTPGAARESEPKSTWSDGDRPATSDNPILVRNGSTARRRIEASFDEFRQLFPAALCYTKIVPVDEVVTLTLYYREDDHLRRLLLDPAEIVELEQLWSELHFVSQDALKLVDAYEQLWQFATQDADPSAFEPMREPIKKRAEAFRRELTEAQPAQFQALLQFAARAYRRPLTTEDERDLRRLYQRLRDEEIPHEQALRLTLARVLVAPAFLYRAEKPVPGAHSGPVSDWELATRLSYFLWSSTPDEALRSAAAAGRLQHSDELAAQARRMLKDPKIRRMATEFACTWLHVYAFDELSEKSERHFPTFPGLRRSMYEETIRFFTDLLQNNGSVLDVINADFTYLNADLATHYGLKLDAAPGADGWSRVDGLRKLGRGGVLAQATTLAKQSGASRTSPILRGNWVGEVLLGEKLPRPPKEVPRLPEDEATQELTVRQLTEKHSTDPKCFGCHRRIDPYGYALEGYDAIGRTRAMDLGGHAVDTRTRLMDGTDIDGIDGLRRYISVQRQDAFLKQFSRKLLGYALGRGVLLSDNPLTADLRAQLKAGNYRMATAIEAIVRSRQFREIRGAEVAFDE